MNPYADFVMQTDGHMGELLAAIKEAGIDDDTLVFFTSDNGCSPEGNFAKLKNSVTTRAPGTGVTRPASTREDIAYLS